MKIAIIGYGKMGKEIEKAALIRNHEISVIIDNPSDWEKKGGILHDCDAAIEFSVPSSVTGNLKQCMDAGVPVVTGTTGWNDKIEEISQYCAQKNATLFCSSNFSIGVNILFDLNRHLASVMNRFSEYDLSIEEIHHVQKLDAPSGTAITLAKEILERIDRKKSWINSPSDNPDDLEILSLREGSVTGIHEIIYKSGIDQISLRHEAFNRQGFALGAIMAAEFIQSKKGVYGMNDMLSL